MNVQKAHADAQRLLRVLVAAGANSAEPMANTWIQQRAAHSSFAHEELIAAMQYAWEQGWVDKGPGDGLTLLTVAGQRAGSA